MSYLPGQGIRLTTDVYALGVLTNASVIALTIKYADGSTATPTVINDSVGIYHADVLVPSVVGNALYRWQTSGATPTQDSVAEGSFMVSSLSF